MDKNEIMKAIEIFAKKVNEKYDCVKIFLFGSYAKGNNNPDSDIDIAVVLKDFKNIIKIQQELLRLRRKIDIRIEPHPIREIDFIKGTPLVEEIKKYGKVINLD